MNVRPSHRSANRQNCCHLEFCAKKPHSIPPRRLLIILHRFLERYANGQTSTFTTLLSQNNSITWVLFSCRGCCWIGPDTCIRTSRGNAWFTTGVTQSFVSPSKPPRTQPQLRQTFAVGVCWKLILHVSCPANLVRYAMFSMVAQSHFTKDGTLNLGGIILFCPPSVTGWTPSGEKRSTQLAVQATVATKEKARYIQFTRAGQ